MLNKKIVQSLIVAVMIALFPAIGSAHADHDHEAAVEVPKSISLYKKDSNYRLMTDLIVAGVDVNKGKLKEGIKEFQEENDIIVSGLLTEETQTALHAKRDAILAEDKQLAAEFRASGKVNLKDGQTYRSDSDSTMEYQEHYEALAYKTLERLPKAHADHLKRLTIFYAQGGTKGLGGGSTIILRAAGVSDEDFVGVLVHEVGHVVDTGLFEELSGGKSAFSDGNSPIYNDDTSLKFYTISWEDEFTRKKGVSKEDFVSGYAYTDPFEDFAEAYTLYVLHGRQFREMTEHNAVLKQKYDVLRDYYFDGVEYDTGKQFYFYTPKRSWDITALRNDSYNFAPTQSLVADIASPVIPAATEPVRSRAHGNLEIVRAHEVVSGSLTAERDYSRSITASAKQNTLQNHVSTRSVWDRLMFVRGIRTK